jgi:hypothetical protein
MFIKTCWFHDDTLASSLFFYKKEAKGKCILNYRKAIFDDDSGDTLRWTQSFPFDTQSDHDDYRSWFGM